MEIRAALEAVRANDGPLLVVSDSTYVVNCFRDRWWQGWLERGWTNSAKKPVANRDLWEPLVELYVDRGDIAFGVGEGPLRRPDERPRRRSRGGRLPGVTRNTVARPLDRSKESRTIEMSLHDTSISRSTR